MGAGEVVAALASLSFNAAVGSAEDLQRLLVEIHDTSARALGLFTAIGQRFHGSARGARTVGLLVLVALGAIAMGRGVEKLAELAQVSGDRASGRVQKEIRDRRCVD